MGDGYQSTANLQHSVRQNCKRCRVARKDNGRVAIDRNHANTRLVDVDDFVRELWELYQDVRREGIVQVGAETAWH
jgi:hypothetical protein